MQYIEELGGGLFEGLVPLIKALENVKINQRAVVILWQAKQRKLSSGSSLITA
jgi:hypothetical protein